MREEDDAHGARVSQDGEHSRVAGVYRGYAGDPRKQRAWSAENPGNRAIRAELADAVWAVLPLDGVVLDVGCGTGWWLAELAVRGVPAARLAGCDLLDARVSAARQRVAGAALRVADARALPWGDGAVAAVTLFTTLSSMGDDDARRAALREVRRVLRPGGVVAVWEPRVPTGNRATAPVPLRLLREELGGALRVQTLTLLPPLARRLPGGRGYRVLARVPVLRTHRLVLGQP